MDKNKLIYSIFKKAKDLDMLSEKESHILLKELKQMSLEELKEKEEWYNEPFNY